jgi:hypothetical protein
MLAGYGVVASPHRRRVARADVRSDDLPGAGVEVQPSADGVEPSRRIGQELE